jgi:hypothetical protein
MALNEPDSLAFDLVGTYHAVPQEIVSALQTEYPTWKCAVKIIYQGSKRNTGGSARGIWQ